MEKAHSKSALKLVKASSQSAVPWSTTARGMVRIIHVIPLQQALTKKAKDELINKDRLYDKSKANTQKTQAKENTRPQEFKLHTEQRALKRAMFNYSVATKLFVIEQQKKKIEKVQKIIEEEEIRLLRKEMIPRAQLMPFFDRPFFPQRSNRPLTVPREPSFHMVNGKCWSCISGDELYHFQHAHVWKPVNQPKTRTCKV